MCHYRTIKESLGNKKGNQKLLKLNENENTHTNLWHKMETVLTKSIVLSAYVVAGEMAQQSKPCLSLVENPLSSQQPCEIVHNCL